MPLIATYEYLDESRHQHLNRAAGSSLRTLDLTGIGLADRGGSKLFDTLQSGLCSMLNSLKIGDNKLADHAVGMPMVDVLRMESCPIVSLEIPNNQISGTVLARAVKVNKSLTSLDIRGNPIDDTGLFVIGGLLLADDCDCRLMEIRTDVFVIENQMKSLSLQNSSLEPGAARLLFGILKYNMTLTELDLSATSIDHASLPDFAKALHANRALISLDMSDTPAVDGSKYDTSSGADSDGRSAPAPRLSKGVEAKVNPKVLHAFAEAVGASPTLQKIVLEGGELPVQLLKGGHAGGVRTKTLDLARQQLSFISGVHIGALIRENQVITDLNLASNELGPDGMTLIVNQLHACSSLNSLDLCNNMHGPGDRDVAQIHKNKAGAKTGAKTVDLELTPLLNRQLAALTTALSKLSMLEKLHLDSNQISELPTVCNLSSLKVLSLQSNRLTAMPEDIGSLRQLKRLSMRANKLIEIHPSIGYLLSLEFLDLRANKITYLPTAIGQLRSLKSFDLADNVLQRLEIAICDLRLLEKLELQGNPLQRPPLAIAKQGVPSIRRYFQDIAKSGETTSNAGRLVLLGHGESGKTSLQRGLRYGAPRPSEKDERTIQLDIYSLLLGEGADQVLLSMWDLAGQPQYAAGLQPYIVSGSLYLLLVPALQVSELDANYPDLLGRWLDYLQAGAPEAVVQPVITHCDRLFATPGAGRTHAMFENAAATQIEWIKTNIALHQSQQGDAKRLRVQERVVCVSCIAGGDASLDFLRQRLEELVFAKPPLLSSVGQMIPRTWLLAMAYLRALRDGRDPIAAAHASIDLQVTKKGGADAAAQEAANEPAPAVVASSSSNNSVQSSMGKARSYITLAEAHSLWLDEVVPRLANVSADKTVLDDALQLLVNQGEFFASCGIIYLQPDYVTRLLKPLVDHRLSTAVFRKQLLVDATKWSEDKLALLGAAIDCLVKSGELREELLRLFWEPLGLHRDVYGEVLLMMSASGVLFLAEHTQHNRCWVMPMRLPEAQPADAKETWNESAKKPDFELLSLTYRLGRIAPPGIAERLMASCYGFGRYHRFWKRGAVMQTHRVGLHHTQLLIELKTTRPNTKGDSSNVDHELMIELRGPKAQRAEMWAVALHVRKLAALVIEDFPGLPLLCQLACPGCMASADRRECPTKWAADDAMSRPLRCEKCDEQLMLHHVRAEQVPSPKPLNLSLNVSDEDAAQELVDAGGLAYSEHKFVATKMRFGKPIEASLALHKLLGRTEDELHGLLGLGEAAIIEEIVTHGRVSRDEYGWTDTDWLKYVRDARALEHASSEPGAGKGAPEILGEYQGSMLIGHAVGAPVGRTSGAVAGAPYEGFDKGHQGMKLDDFVNHPIAVAAGLKRAHVLALRLYSTSVYRSVNKPLHDGCSPERPHPYPALVSNLTEAFRKLRAAAAENETSPVRINGVTIPPAPTTLWRGGTNNEDVTSSEFKQRGGTEVAVLSTTASRGVAEQYAVQAAKVWASKEAMHLATTRTAASTIRDHEGRAAAADQPPCLLIKINVGDPQHFGADISAFSVFPHEKELYFPPCTYLEPHGEHEETVRVGGESITFKVIEVVPMVHI